MTHPEAEDEWTGFDEALTWDGVLTAGRIDFPDIDWDLPRRIPWEPLVWPLEASMTIDFELSPENWAAICRLVHSGHPLPFARRRYSRCPLCHPLGNPARLAIDGQEYARRRKARKKRR